MKINIPAILIIGLLSFNACAETATRTGNLTNSENSSGVNIKSNADATTAAVENAAEKPDSNEFEPGTGGMQTKKPRTVRDFFNLLPQEYFPLEGCEPAKDKDCKEARREYVKTFLEVEDTANGYWKSGCDGAQSCLRMALFKRPDGTYVVAVHTLHEADETNHFLEYKNGKWSDISAQVMPDFSNKLIYELPRKGTTIEVYKKDFPEPEFSERGAKLYNLEWKDGKFVKGK